VAAILYLVPINYLTNAWVNRSDFFVAYWGWLEVGSCWWPAPPLIQDGRYGSHLRFGFHQLSDEPLSWVCRIESILRVCVCVCVLGQVVSIFNITILGWGVMLALRSYFFSRCPTFGHNTSNEHPLRCNCKRKKRVPVWVLWLAIGILWFTATLSIKSCQVEKTSEHIWTKFDSWLRDRPQGVRVSKHVTSLPRIEKMRRWN
jgi:hypothetical protein